ncbi:hypothetical protein [Acinetobacter sp. COS3]|uniref:hypothetical protein n=1 Tax=Acinetobacter sp. COS3 TaxID=1397525 RepID=UPI0004BA3E73|nr:hypothetical protein [Acinetobacter sp. COS3]
MRKLLISKNMIIYFYIYLIFISVLLLVFNDSKIGDFFVTSHDEYRYYVLSNYVMADSKSLGWLYIFQNYYDYSQSLHFGYYMYLGFVRNFINDNLGLWYVFQTTIFFLANLYFSKFICLEFKLPEKDSYYLSILMIFYLPLFYLTFSLMRDVSIFFLISISLYLYKKEKFYLMGFFMLVLITYRMNACLGIVVYVIFDLILSRKIQFKSLVYAFLFVFFVSLYILNNYFDKFMERIYSLDYLSVLFESFRFMFSPIPWQVDAYIPFYLYIWYYISFFACIFGVFLYMLFFSYNKNNILFSKSLVAMILFNVFAYSTEVGVGFRQTAVLSPFLFVPVFISVIKRVKI